MARRVFYGRTSKKNHNKITILWKGEVNMVIITEPTSEERKQAFETFGED
ncbi:hypothetical protein HOS79_gp034 [Lactobacillus phage Nyseid]|uniref:Uncharacterized protein n=1 Tax=Lactobacillus phage Nyseid TaxID=2079432 RepID=A0A2K9VCA3_9CAUD|nr:hypothetical protein HOS79_gp034 [Lactobacillus phage Nyseid]AUV59794.1 hypothetical protein [Lactobacillus phage Nyseid]